MEAPCLPSAGDRPEENGSRQDILAIQAHFVALIRVTILASCLPAPWFRASIWSPVPVGFINARKCQRAALFQSTSQEGYWDRPCPWGI